MSSAPSSASPLVRFHRLTLRPRTLLSIPLVGALVGVVGFKLFDWRAGGMGGSHAVAMGVIYALYVWGAVQAVLVVTYIGMALTRRWWRHDTDAAGTVSSS